MAPPGVFSFPPPFPPAPDLSAPPAGKVISGMRAVGTIASPPGRTGRDLQDSGTYAHLDAGSSMQWHRLKELWSAYFSEPG